MGRPTVPDATKSWLVWTGKSEGRKQQGNDIAFNFLLLVLVQNCLILRPHLRHTNWSEPSLPSDDGCASLQHAYRSGLWWPSLGLQLSPLATQLSEQDLCDPELTRSGPCKHLVSTQEAAEILLADFAGSLARLPKCLPVCAMVQRWSSARLM